MDKQTSAHKPGKATAGLHARRGSNPDVRAGRRARAPLAPEPLSAAELLHLWQQLSGDPEAPDAFELTEHGEMVVSVRATTRHQAITEVVAQELRERLEGHVLREVAVLTPYGIRVPDLVWLAPDRYAETLSANPDRPLELCPPLVVEVVGTSSCDSAVAHRCAALLAAGAEEVMLVSLHGQVRYRRADGLHDDSCHGLALRLGPALLAH